MSTDTRSTETRTGRSVGRTLGRDDIDFGLDASASRAAALGGVALLIAAYWSVFYSFSDVTGVTPTFVLVSVGALGAATVLASVLTVRRATLVGLGVLGAGLALYVVTLPRRPPLMPLMTDAVALTTGRTLLLVTNLDVWVVGVAPGPLFLTWYLALRRRYVSAVLIGGGTLGFLILTSDAAVVTALMGVVGAIVAVAVGDMDRRGDSLAAAESLAVVLAGMILLAGLAPLVPSGSGQSATVWSNFQDGGAPETIEGSLVHADNELGIQGNLSLSPEVRFRVESSETGYWQVGAYDRYTGDRWLRTGGSNSFDTRRAGPPGESRRVDQTITAVDELGVVPAAWKPVSVGDSIADETKNTDEGTFVVDGSVPANSSYAVRSQVPVTDSEQLRSAGADYPSDVVDRYTEVPSSTSDRVGERTERLTANADNPYDTARVIERWLANNKSYSLNVSKPDGNTAEEFLFEMDAGYCTYFATTMVTMLRTQDVPARFAVGYTPGERVDRDEWVVRGFNAHAWVQVYFPEVGWVDFDPTPASSRDDRRQQILDQARESNDTDVDLGDTGDEEWTSTPTATPAPLTPQPDAPVGQGPSTIPERETPPDGFVDDPGGPVNVTITDSGTLTDSGTAGPDGGSGGSGGLVTAPDLSREETTLLSIVLIGLIVGVRRSGIAGRTYRAVWLRYQPRADPLTDAERAYERLEHVLAERYRPREPGETARQYLASIGADERARTVSEIRERARYAGDVTRDEADRAVEIVDEVVSESKRV